MDYSSLPQYRGLDDGSAERDREPFDRNSLGASIGLFVICVAVIVVTSAVAFYLVAGLVAAPAG
jgi:hypothetical protein